MDNLIFKILCYLFIVLIILFTSGFKGAKAEAYFLRKGIREYSSMISFSKHMDGGASMFSADYVSGRFKSDSLRFDWGFQLGYVDLLSQSSSEIYLKSGYSYMLSKLNEENALMAGLHGGLGLGSMVIEGEMGGYAFNGIKLLLNANVGIKTRLGENTCINYSLSYIYSRFLNNIDVGVPGFGGHFPSSNIVFSIGFSYIKPDESKQ